MNLVIQTIAKENQTQSTLDLELEADLASHTINIWHLNSKAMFYLKELIPLAITLSVASLVVYILYHLLDYIQRKI